MPEWTPPPAEKIEVGSIVRRKVIPYMRVVAVDADGGQVECKQYGRVGTEWIDRKDLVLAEGVVS